MHFRVRKNVVQLVRNTYDAKTKKAVASVVGRMPLAEPVLTNEISGMLTSDEVAETKEWIETQHRLAALRSELAALQLAESLDLATQWFDRNPESKAARNEAPQIVQSWQRLRAVLKKKGFIE